MRAKLKRGGFIYGLTDPRYDNEVRYVGKTMGALHGRLWSHVNEAKKKPDSHIARLRWIQKLLLLGLKPGICVIEQSDEWDDATAYKHEAFWISYYRFRFGKRMLNIADGGDHTVWATTAWTPEMRAHASRKTKEYYALHGSNQGETRYVEARKKGLAAFWADPERSDAERQKTSKRMKDYWNSLSKEERAARWTPEIRAKASASHTARMSDPAVRKALGISVKAAMSPEVIAARNKKSHATFTAKRGYAVPPDDYERPCAICGKILENPTHWYTRSCPPCKNEMIRQARLKTIESSADYKARILREWNDTHCVGDESSSTDSPAV